jgi:hypothetical protein
MYRARGAMQSEKKAEKASQEDFDKRKLKEDEKMKS